MSEKDHVSVTFFTRVNIRAEEFAREFFKLLPEHDGDLVPQEFDGGELTNHGWTVFDPTRLELAVQVWTQLGNVLMRRREPIETMITLSMNFAASGRFNTASVSVEESYLTSSSNIVTFLEMCVALYNLLHPAYGMAHQIRDKLEMSTVVDPRYGRTVIPTNLSRGIPGVYWGNFLGPEYVAMLGRDHLQLAPYFNIQSLRDGGVLVLTSPSPIDPSAQRSRHARTRLRDFLGEDVFYPSNVTSARVPQFRFDGPPILPGEDVDLSVNMDTLKRKAKSQNFIDNAKDLADLLIDELAEEGIENPGLDFDTLLILDQVLQRRKEAEETLDEFTAKAFAAYAGEIARRIWNGHWIVDEITGEAAVQIKGAKFFPLARVIKFWDSQERDAFTTVLKLLSGFTE